MELGNAANGAACGTSQVCNAGACVSCTSGLACTPPGNICKTGMTSCSTGVSSCVETGNVKNGTSCGSDLVCYNGGCSACVVGGSCVPANPCHKGVTSCDTGQPVCTDIGTPLVDGVPCGTGRVCSAGTCYKDVMLDCTVNKPLTGDLTQTCGQSCSIGAPNNAELIVGGASGSYTVKILQSYVSFDCNGAPSADYLQSATMTIYQVDSSLEGKHTDVHHLVFPVISGDYWDNAPLDVPGAFTARMSVSEDKVLDVTTSVRTDLKAGRAQSQFRLIPRSEQYAYTTGVTYGPPDSANPPRLRLRFLVP
jgi:hypothetical protein